MAAKKKSAKKKFHSSGAWQKKPATKKDEPMELLRQLVEEVHLMREAIAKSSVETWELKEAVGRLGQRIGEYIEHQFHSVK